MTIVAAAAAPNETFAGAPMAVVCLAVGVPLTVRLLRRGVFAAGDRLPPGGSAWPLAMAMAWGLFLWLAVPLAYLSSRGLPSRAHDAAATTTPAATTQQVAPVVPAPGGKGVDLSSLPPFDVAFLSTVPHLVVFLGLCAIDVLIYAGDLTPLGFSPRRAAGGLATGAKFAVAFVPLVFAGAILTDWLYQWVHYEHPREHDLLRVLGQSAQASVRLAIVAGATVIAPLSEELLFRGHAQTILRRVVSRLAAPKPAPESASANPPAPAIALAYAGPLPSASPPAWVPWLAIVLTSALFASVHERWTWPPIFLLSLCLGWAYERTGNLWAPVAVHATFNAVSTLIFLAGAG